MPKDLLLGLCAGGSAKSKACLLPAAGFFALEGDSDASGGERFVFADVSRTGADSFAEGGVVGDCCGCPDGGSPAWGRAEEVTVEVGNVRVAVTCWVEGGRPTYPRTSGTVDEDRLLIEVWPFILATCSDSEGGETDGEFGESADKGEGVKGDENLLSAGLNRPCPMLGLAGRVRTCRPVACATSRPPFLGATPCLDAGPPSSR